LGLLDLGTDGHLGRAAPEQGQGSLRHLRSLRLGLTRAQEPIAKLSFSAYPTSLAIAGNSSPERVDILIGFHTGDVLWLDPICARYTRLNKLGALTTSAVTCLAWVPSGNGSLFASGHADGCVFVWDRDRDDGPFDAPPPPLRQQPKTGVTTASSPASLDEVIAEAAEDIVVTTPPPAERKGKTVPLLNPLSHWWVSRKALTGAPPRWLLESPP
jgi:WD40 repeat protein